MRNLYKTAAISINRLRDDTSGGKSDEVTKESGMALADPGGGLNVGNFLAYSPLALQYLKLGKPLAGEVDKG